MSQSEYIYFDTHLSPGHAAEEIAGTLRMDLAPGSGRAGDPPAVTTASIGGIDGRIDGPLTINYIAPALDLDARSPFDYCRLGWMIWSLNRGAEYELQEQQAEAISIKMSEALQYPAVLLKGCDVC